MDVLSLLLTVYYIGKMRPLGVFVAWVALQAASAPRCDENLYDVTAQPTIVIVSTTSSKPMLTMLSTFPCPSK
jgi:hypothetical protein